MTTTSGVLREMSSRNLGDELAVDAAAGAVVLTVADAADFDPAGGYLSAAGSSAVQYVTADLDASTVTLASGLAAAAAAGDRVDVWDVSADSAAVEYRALVDDLGEPGDLIDAVVAAPVAVLMPEGIRDEGQGETVVLDDGGGAGWVVTNVLGRAPQIQGHLIAPATIPQTALGFTLTNGTRVTVADTAPADPAVDDLWIDASDGNVVKRWDGSAWVPYQFGASAIEDAAIDATKVSFTARDVGGVTTSFAATAPSGAVAGDLWYDTANDYQLNRYSGSAWVPAEFGAGAIADGSLDSTKISFTARDIGGVTTSFAASAPASPKAGDLWYDTANGYKLNRYSGSAWVAAQLGTNAIAAGAITAALIAADTITAAQIAAGAVTTTELAANAVTAAKIAAGTITAAQIAAGTITATQIAANTITAALIAADTITAAQIAAGAVTTTELAANAVTAAKIAAGTITGDRIAAGTVTGDLIAAGAIIAEHIAAGALDAATIRTISLSAVTMSGRMVGSVLSSSDFLVDNDGGRVLAYAQTPTVDLDRTTPGSGSFTAPVAGQYKVEGWGAGGSGSRNGGGSAGEYAYEFIMLTAGQVVPYTVGAGGAAGALGADGGDTTFGVLTAHGGKAGDAGTDARAPGGTGSTNAVHFGGGRGGRGFAGKAGGGGGSAGVALAGMDGGDATFSTNGAGGAAQPGGGAGGAGSSTGNGTAGSTPGGGGGGSVSFNGGAGGAGKLRVTHYVSSPLVAIASAAGTDDLGNDYPGGATIYPLTITDCNAALTPGSYYGVGGAVVNSPDDGKSWVLYVHGRGTPGPAGNVGRSLMQVAHRVDVTTTSTAPAEIWARTCSAGGAWQSWYQLSGPPAWTAVTAASGYSGTDWAVSRFADGKVRLRGQVSKTGGFSTGYATAGTLPSSAYAPTTDVRVPICAAASGGVFGVLRIDAGSTSIQISAQTGATPGAFYTTTEWDSL